MKRVLEDINPRGIASAYIEAPFDIGKKALEDKGYTIISLQENARLRIQEGKGAFVSRNGNRVREDIIYVPKKGYFLTKISHIMAHAKEATDWHRLGIEYYLSNEQVEQSLSDSVALSFKSIPTNRFADCDINIYAFGDIAGKYGEFLREAGIKEMPIWIWNAELEYKKEEFKPFARKPELVEPDPRCLFFNDRNLYCNIIGVRGIRESKKSLENIVRGK